MPPALRNARSAERTSRPRRQSRGLPGETLCRIEVMLVPHAESDSPSSESGAARRDTGAADNRRAAADRDTPSADRRGFTAVRDTISAESRRSSGCGVLWSARSDSSAARASQHSRYSITDTADRSARSADENTRSTHRIRWPATSARIPLTVAGEPAASHRVPRAVTRRTRADCSRPVILIGFPRVEQSRRRRVIPVPPWSTAVPPTVTAAPITSSERPSIVIALPSCEFLKPITEQNRSRGEYFFPRGKLLRSAI